MARLKVCLSSEERRFLAQMAAEQGKTEDELIAEALRRLVNKNRLP